MEVEKRKGKKKVKKVMGEYKRGKLKSSNGKKVTSKKQAVAIAMNEAGMTRKHWNETRGKAMMMLGKKGGK